MTCYHRLLSDTLKDPELIKNVRCGISCQYLDCKDSRLSALDSKFANDCLSGIEDSAKGSIIGAAITIYRKVQRFLRPTHLNRLPGFSAQRSEKRAKQICKFVEAMYRAVMNLLFEGWNLNSFTQSDWRQLKQYHAGGLDKRVRETCLEISKAPIQPYEFWVCVWNSKDMYHPITCYDVTLHFSQEWPYLGRLSTLHPPNLVLLRVY